MVAHTSALLIATGATAEEFDALTAQQVLTSWATGEPAEAVEAVYRTPQRLAVVMTIGEAHFLVTTSTDEDGDILDVDRIEVRGPYPTYTNHAQQDAWRDLIKHALTHDTVSHVTGWDDEVIVLVRSPEGFTVAEVRRSGITTWHHGQILAATERYAQRVAALGRDLETAPGLDPVTRITATSWLQLSAAEAWAAQARTTMGVALAGFFAMQKVESSGVCTPKELAAHLHVATGKVTSAIRKAVQDNPQFATVEALQTR